MNILLFGPPGSGKGTQSDLLVEQLQMKHISTGDLFRKNIKRKTDLGFQAKSFIDKGKLVPNQITINMLFEVLENTDGRNFILDGFPRNLNQAEALRTGLARLDFSLDKAIFIDVPQNYLVQRLSGRRVCKDCGQCFHIKNNRPIKEGLCDSCEGVLFQREDDASEVIKNRLKVYQDQTAPLEDFYKKENLLIRVDGKGTVKEVFNEICSQIQGRVEAC